MTRPTRRSRCPPRSPPILAHTLSLHATGVAEWSSGEIYLALPRPGGDGWVTLDRTTGAVETENTDRGWISWLNDLHKGRNAGPAWKWFIDIFAVACLIFSVTGLFLLQLHSAKRRMTWPIVGMGLLIPASSPSISSIEGAIMKRTHSLALTAPLLTGLAASPAAAAGIDLTVTIPQLKVAEYHRPYVAIYLEQTGQPVRNLALWYDADNKEDGGRKWLTELRQWWRKSGRTLKLPADGITGATRAPGPQKIAFAAGKAPLGTLPAGQYTLVVEAAREVGGKEVVRLPFAWPAKTPQALSATGTTELGAVTATIKP